MKLYFSFLIYLIFFVSVSYSQKTGSGIYDIDSNSYTTVFIDKKEWMSENLNTTRFTNGDTIPQAKSNEEWIKAGEAGQPAWCYSNNDSTYGIKYGKLYNWYAVADPRGLAPEGWHIPTQEEFIQLSDFLGGESIAGVKLKSDTKWGSYGNGTNSSGFCGLPAGERHKDGFYLIGNHGGWWSTTESDSNKAFCIGLGTFVNILSIYDSEMLTGKSIRCIRD